MMKAIKYSIVFLFLAALLSACSLFGGGANPTVAPNDPSETITAEKESQQVIGTTPTREEDVIERQYSDTSDSPKYEIQAIWPNLSESVAHSQFFNQAIDTLVQTTQVEFLGNITAQQGSDGEGAVTSTLAIDYDLTYAEAGLYSVQLTATQYIALSVHPFTTSRTLNFDANQGVFLSLSDLFLPDSLYMSNIRTVLDATLVERSFDYTVGTAGDVMEERENWNLMPEGLRFNFDEYEIGPYAAGPQSVLIPWRNLQWLNPQGPAGIFIAP